MSSAIAVNAKFTGTSLLWVNFENADLRDSVFDRATLLEARLYDAKLRGVSINDQTVFGERTVYEREADPSESSYSVNNKILVPIDRPYPAQAVQSLFSQFINTVKQEEKRFRAHRTLNSIDRRKTSNQLSKAISVYRARQRLHRENSQPEDVETPYIREKSCRRKRAFVQEQWGQWLKRAVFRWVMLYGESPTRVVLTSIAVITFFAALYPLFGGVHIESAAATHTFFEPRVYIGIDSRILETITASLYFSAVTFSTLGYGGIQPATSATQFLASVQSLLGGILIALLVAVFARRALR